VPQWLKNLTLILVLLGWSATVIAQLRSGDLPDAKFLGVPVAAVVMLARSVRLPKKRAAGNRRPADVAASHDDDRETKK
jgi:hypothetical protein